MDENRKLLDELMGANRNGDVDEDKRHKITDANICRNFLCGFCPPELFTNTKSALATCYKVHDDVLQKEFVKGGKGREGKESKGERRGREG